MFNHPQLGTKYSKYYPKDYRFKQRSKKKHISWTLRKSTENSMDQKSRAWSMELEVIEHLQQCSCNCNHMGYGNVIDYQQVFIWIIILACVWCTYILLSPKQLKFDGWLLCKWLLKMGLLVATCLRVKTSNVCALSNLFSMYFSIIDFAFVVKARPLKAPPKINKSIKNLNKF